MGRYFRGSAFGIGANLDGYHEWEGKKMRGTVVYLVMAIFNWGKCI